MNDTHKELTYKENKISVITICYNSEDGIRCTLESVIAQDYPNLEYIVIDGASQDRTVEIITQYSSELDYWVSEPDLGISDAFNKGIIQSQGDWIIFINAGDRFVNDTVVSEIVSILQGTDTDVLYGNVLMVKKNSISARRGKTFSRKKLSFEMIIPHQASFINQQYFAKYGLFNTEFKRAMDYELLLRSPKLRAQYFNIDIAYMEDGGISQVNVRKVFKELMKAKKMHLDKSALRVNVEYLVLLLRYKAAKIFRRFIGKKP